MKLVIIFAGCLISWILSYTTGAKLFRANRENQNPLEWQVIDRCLLLIVVYFALGGVTCFMGGIQSLFRVGHVPWVNFEFWDAFLPALIVLGFLLVLLWVAGVQLRKTKRGRMLYVHAVVQYSAVIMASVCYVFGPMTDPKGFLAGIAQGSLNLILFGTVTTVPWVATYTLMVIALMTAVWFHWIPYAPFYAPTAWGSQHFDGLYWMSMLAQELFLFLLLIFLMAYIVSRWKEKEDKLEDMSVFLKKMFGRYLSREVMTSLIQDPLSLELGGKRRRVTIMMTDLRGFTAMSERFDPEQVVQILNAYFEVMVDLVMKYEGTISEIIGDALVVIFGAPDEMADRNQKAIACAIEMQNAMAEVNRQNRLQGFPEIEMGIGLNEAEVVVGNIGSSKRSTYTAIGSGVNMASRIESFSVGGQILVSESVRLDAGDVLRIDEERDVQPKGSEHPLRIYSVGGIAGPYHLALSKTESQLVSLSPPIEIQISIIEGKQVEGRGISGHLCALSRKKSRVRTSEPIGLLSNLRMHLKGVHEALSLRTFYGKITDVFDQGGDEYIVRFTAIPPEIDAYFQACLHFADSRDPRDD